jgi:hypothetical protein
MLAIITEADCRVHTACIAEQETTLTSSQSNGSSTLPVRGIGADDNMEPVIIGRRYKVTIFAELSCGGREERGKHHGCELWFESGARTPYE